ncbi:hypothetical protein [Paraburkholderia unamae]|uniref:Uncharacterized protein n=1 Tax=Paraburkholderia unamae TaxID=219649 RepID=A0ABX5KT28_9BURK|nr:hypothetical protein [Paraburkholderia unamae]PVX86258.1 hypothetical protein C7402_10294 [Paraburkholderia unamae]
MCAICNFRIEFGVGHPQALSVATATRSAIESGLLAEDKAGDVLATARQRLAAIETLKLFQNTLESTIPNDALLALPDFYVLLIESETWEFFHATPDGFDPDAVPDIPDIGTQDMNNRSNVLVTADLTLRAMLAGRIDMDQALDRRIALIDAPAAQSEKLRMAIREALAIGLPYPG